MAASGSLQKFKTFEDRLDPELFRKQSIDSFANGYYHSEEVDELLSLLLFREEKNQFEDYSQLALILEKILFVSTQAKSFAIVAILS